MAHFQTDACMGRAASCCAMSGCRRTDCFADRGLGDQNLYGLLTEELHFDSVIRLRGNIKMTAVRRRGRHRRNLCDPERVGPCDACSNGDGGLPAG